MIRIATVSAFAALLMAAPAFAAPAPGVTVQIAGRSAGQVRHDIGAAATQTCVSAMRNDVFEDESQDECESATVAAAYRTLAAYNTSADDSRLAMELPAGQ